MMATVLVTGGTGLIGKALTAALIENQHKVIVLTRHLRPAAAGIHYAFWDIDAGIIDDSCIRQADYIIHLAGANIAEKRWTKKRKRQILESRVKSSALIVKILREVPNKIRAVISASAIGWYNADNGGPEKFLESDPAGLDFLAATCKAWEAAIGPVTESGRRLVILRTGIVLSRGGGAFEEFLKPFKFRIAAILGTGRQVISWIHIKDLVRLYLYSIENDNMKGIYNAVTPGPVTNAELMQAIGAATGRRYMTVYVPSIILKLVLGEMSIEVLKNAPVSSAKIETAGFKFLYPTIDLAIPELAAR
jgi:uncharacterized protein